MTLDEARRILGLEPGEDAAQFLPDFEVARDRIAEMVREASNDTLALRYQEGLAEFEEALALVRAQVRGAAAAAPEPAVPEAVLEGGAEGMEVAVRPSRRGRWAAVGLALLVIVCGGWWLASRVREDIRLQRQARLVFLERQGAILAENRRWAEALAAYDEIEALDPGSMIARAGRRDIEAGIAEEQRQFLAYWAGEAEAAIESGRWADAEHALATLAARDTGSAELVSLRRRIDDGRRLEVRQQALEGARKALAGGAWAEARALADRVLAVEPDNAEAAALRQQADTGEERQLKDHQRARDLLARARDRDTGAFDQRALEWISEAVRLAPADKEIAALYDKLSKYTRTLAVPGDFASIGAAVAAARPRDRIRVGAGTWNESLQIDKPVELVGEGRDKTIIECAAEDGPVLGWGSAAAGGQASGIQLRHRTVAPESERFSVVLVRGGRVALADCEMRDGSGHGVAVIEGGCAALTRCRFVGNGWDGAAAYGEGSRVEVHECEAEGNFEHGIDAWSGGVAVVRDSRATGNGRNGVFIASPGAVLVSGSHVAENREFGIVIAACSGGTVAGNKVERNQLGGLAFHRAAADLEVRDNQATRNGGPGLVLDRGFAARLFEQNTSTQNTGPRQVVDDVELDAGRAGDGGE